MGGFNHLVRLPSCAKVMELCIGHCKCCAKTIGIDSPISEVAHLKKKEEEEENFPFGDLLFWSFHDILPYH